MPIDEKTAAGLARLAKALPGQARMIELVALVGNGLAAPLARVRANQANREALRTIARFGGRSPEAAAKVAESARAAELTTSIDGEIARLSLDPPVPGEGQAVVYGYVTNNGKPVPDIMVGLAPPNGRPATEMKTANDGSFILTAAAPAPLGLVVRKGETVLSRDEDPWYAAAARPYYRLVDLAGESGQKPPQQQPPAPPPPREPGITPVGRSPYSDLTLNQALARLADDDLRLGRIALMASGAEHGHVVTATKDSRTGAVNLQVAVGSGDADRLELLAVLIANDGRAKAAGIESIDQARTALRNAETASLEDARQLAGLSDTSIARKAKVGGGKKAQAFRDLLHNALDRLGTP